MLTIRKAQMDVLSAYARECFIKKTSQNALKLFPDDPKIKSEPALRALIEGGIAQAASYGIEGEREVGLFIFLACDFGLGFEKQKDKRWIQRILLDKSFDGQEKMDVIYKRLELASGKS